jgi:hypothetical protein
MRLTIIVLLLVPLLGALSWAQTSSPIQASPAAVASPGAGQMPGMTGAPQPRGMTSGKAWAGWHHCSRRGVRIVFFVLHVLLALSGIFVLTALGIFLLRRSRPRP